MQLSETRTSFGGGQGICTVLSFCIAMRLLRGPAHIAPVLTFCRKQGFDSRFAERWRLNDERRGRSVGADLKEQHKILSRKREEMEAGRPSIIYSVGSEAWN